MKKEQSLNNPFRNLGYSVGKDGTVKPQKIREEAKEKPTPVKKVKHSRYNEMQDKFMAPSDENKTAD